MSAPDSRDPRPAEVLLSVEDVSKSYGRSAGDRVTIIDGVSFDVRRGEFVTIVGPSGAGKTTLLRCMAGLVRPDSGRVLMGGKEIVEPPGELAVVFQDYSRSLMPWMTVLSNVVLPLRRKRLSRSELRSRGEAALEAVGLSEAASLHPWQLSGGMQQRVAIARGIAYEPEALIMDEPFASVDAQTRAELEDLTLKVRETLNMSMVLVTHDIDEAVYLADRVLVLKGRPAAVDCQLEVPLGPSRDQLATKAEPEFVRLRTEVLSKIRTTTESTAATS